jgi:hypothetical protein
MHLDLTSVVDVEFGADGRLYVVEMDASGWFAAGSGTGGTACDVDNAIITTPGAITFDHGPVGQKASSSVRLVDPG